MKHFFCLFFTLICCGVVHAQTSYELPKVWQGFVTVTSIGAQDRHNPRHEGNVGKDKAITGWNTYQIPFTLTVLRQEGRHLQLSYQSEHIQTDDIGTLSADGKQLQIAFINGTGVYEINGNKMTGCGSTRGGKGNFAHWLQSYSTWCAELVAVH
jgi:hypothetical protein